MALECTADLLFQSPSGDRPPVYAINPLRDARWKAFANTHPLSSIFHTVGWLDALRRTYGYEPVALTTSPAGEKLRNGVVLCRVDSPLTGSRFVSVPFSDYCEPLVDNAVEFETLLSAVERPVREEKLYVEFRPMHPLEVTTSLFPSKISCCLHRLDLKPDLDDLFRNCHKNSTQRKVHRASREKLGYEEGRSRRLLGCFYDLFVVTRRRHHVPPPPKAWFENLVDCLGEALQIRVAYQNEIPVASVITLRHNDTMVYKYACSDTRFHNLGAMHLLIWRSIEEAKRDNLRTFDFGRSEWTNTQLLTFKDRWGSERFPITYLRFTKSSDSKGVYPESGTDWKLNVARRVFSHLPERVLRAVGTVLYRHIG